MTKQKKFWVTVRILVVVAAPWQVPALSPAGSNLNWMACALISVSMAVFLFGWLVAAQGHDGIEWSRPYSLVEPFWPMHRYPLRFWYVSGVSCLAGGAGTIVEQILRSGDYYAFGGTFLCLGVVMIMLVTGFSTRRRVGKSQ